MSILHRNRLRNAGVWRSALLFVLLLIKRQALAQQPMVALGDLIQVLVVSGSLSHGR